MLKTFKRGVHPPESKYTASDPLSEFETPDRVFVSLAQSAGAPCEPVVKEGDKVKAGTLIGRAKGFVSANVFSSVSGEVKGFVKLPSSNGFKVMHVKSKTISNMKPKVCLRFSKGRLPLYSNGSNRQVLSVWAAQDFPLTSS